MKNFGIRHAVTVVSSGQPVVYAKGPITICIPIVEHYSKNNES